MNRFASAGLVLLAAGCNPQPAHGPSAATPASSPSTMPALEITGEGTSKRPIVITGQSGNRKVYRLVTRSYVSHSAQSIAQAVFQQPTVTFYDKDGTKLVARAPTAQALRDGKQVVLSGGVRAKTSTGLNLTCDRLTYDQDTALLHGEGHVRITGMQGGQSQTLTGNRFTSDIKLTQMIMR